MIPALPRAVAPRIAAPRGLIPLASRRSGIRDPRVGHRQGEGCGSGAMRGGGPGGRARASAPEAGGLPEMRRGRGEEEPLEVLVVGAGPSGLAVAAAAGREGLHVGVIDPSPESLWANNYGTWVDEFEALGFGDCLSHVWDKVDVVFEDSSPPCTLARPYGQVDRRRLKSRLLENCRETGVGFLAGQVRSVEHLQTCTRATCADGTSVSALLVIDATGYSRRLMQFQSPVGDLDSADVTPGYQVTYGILAEVEAHDLPLDHMVLMDWSDSHLSPELFRQNHAEPSFLYMMPFTPTSVFLEETSLVDRPAVRSEDLRARLKERLGAQGIKVTRVLEEERAMIPMGGQLPVIPQNVVGVGGAAGMVHPSTGYMIARALETAPSIVSAVAPYLKAHRGQKVDLALLSRKGWAAAWPTDEQRQWGFMNLGMQILCELDPQGLRSFFRAFFSLDDWLWGGYLSWRLSAVECVVMGLALLQVAPLRFRGQLVWTALPFLPEFARAWAAGLLWRAPSPGVSLRLRHRWKAEQQQKLEQRSNAEASA